jgi:hypothetical protein
MSQKLSEALKGCAEIPLFFVSGVYRFENTQEDAKKSFSVAIFFLLAQTFMAQVSPDFQNLSYGEIFFRFSASFLLYCYFAFAISTVFRINWMLGAALSILGMACDEFSRFIIYDLVFHDRY